MKKIQCSVAIFCILTTVIHAQIVIVDSGAGTDQVNRGSTYIQDFDSLASPVDQYPWVSNSTLSGWYSNASVIRNYTGEVLQNRGPAGGLGDRALGAQGAPGSNRYFGVRFINASTSELVGVSVTFDGEQWSRLPNRPQIQTTLDFSYKVFEAGQGNIASTSGWVNIDALDFVSPNATLTSFAYIDGNASENSLRDIQSYISGITVAPGQELWLRWASIGVGGTVVNHDLAIDNLRVSFTTIPEPATGATLAGATAFLVLGFRRRNRRS